MESYRGRSVNVAALDNTGAGTANDAEDAAKEADRDAEDGGGVAAEGLLVVDGALVDGGATAASAGNDNIIVGDVSCGESSGGHGDSEDGDEAGELHFGGGRVGCFEKQESVRLFGRLSWNCWSNC